MTGTWSRAARRSAAPRPRPGPGIITSRTIRSGSCLGHLGQRRGAAVRRERLEAVEAQRRGHQVGDVLLVVDDQHPPPRAVHSPAHRAHAHAATRPFDRRAPSVPALPVPGLGGPCASAVRDDSRPLNDARQAAVVPGRRGGRDPERGRRPAPAVPARGPGRRPPAGTPGVPGSVTPLPGRLGPGPRPATGRPASRAGRCAGSKRTVSSSRSAGSSRPRCRYTGSSGPTGARRPAAYGLGPPGSYPTVNEISCSSPRASGRSSSSSAATRPAPGAFGSGTRRTARQPAGLPDPRGAAEGRRRRRTRAGRRRRGRRGPGP